MRGFLGKWARMYGRTNGRTNGGESKGPSTPSRGQEIDNSDVPIWRKLEKNLIFGHLRGLNCY